MHFLFSTTSYLESGFGVRAKGTNIWASRVSSLCTENTFLQSERDQHLGIEGKFFMYRRCFFAISVQGQSPEVIWYIWYIYHSSDFRQPCA